MNYISFVPDLFLWATAREFLRCNSIFVGGICQESSYIHMNFRPIYTNSIDWLELLVLIIIIIFFHFNDVLSPLVITQSSICAGILLSRHFFGEVLALLQCRLNQRPSVSWKIPTSINPYLSCTYNFFLEFRSGDQVAQSRTSTPSALRYFSASMLMWRRGAFSCISMKCSPKASLQSLAAVSSTSKYFPTIRVSCIGCKRYLAYKILPQNITVPSLNFGTDLEAKHQLAFLELVEPKFDSHMLWCELCFHLKKGHFANFLVMISVKVVNFVLSR